MPAQHRHGVARPNHGNAVPVLDDETWIGEQDSIAAAHLDDLGENAVWKHHAADRYARERRSRNEEPRDVEHAAVGRERPGFDAAQLLMRLLDRRRLAEEQQGV